MPKRIGSFRYDELHTKDWYSQCFAGLADEHGLRLVESRREQRATFKPEDVEAAVSELWPEERVRELRESGVIPLSADRMERLCRPVAVETCVFENESRTVSVTVDAADRNEFPCLSVDVWLAGEMSLPGGFVEVTADDKADANRIMAAFARARP